MGLSSGFAIKVINGYEVFHLFLHRFHCFISRIVPSNGPSKNLPGRSQSRPVPRAVYPVGQRRGDLDRVSQKIQLHCCLVKQVDAEVSRGPRLNLGLPKKDRKMCRFMARDVRCRFVGG